MSHKVKILYVDDEEINTMVFQIAFSKTYEVLIADGGASGIELLRKNTDIKFVISDMKMPHMNGLEFIHEVKKEYKHLPCMILSGYQQTPEIFNALNKGIIVSYCMKPFSKTEMVNLMNKYTRANV